MSIVFMCDDIFKLHPKHNEEIVASGSDFHPNIKIGETIWVVYRDIYFKTKVIDTGTSGCFGSKKTTYLKLDKTTVPKELFKVNSK